MGLLVKAGVWVLYGFGRLIDILFWGMIVGIENGAAIFVRICKRKRPD